MLVEHNNNDVSIIETKKEVEEENCYYKNILRIYVLSCQMKDLCGKIIIENELKKLTEQKCDNVY